MTKYSVVLPCFNEAESLPGLVERFRVFTEEWDFELILVDNGSTDDTSTVLEKLANEEKNPFVKAIKIKKNKGYGHGIRKGLESACGEILAFTHADAQTPPEDVFRAFELYQSEKLVPQKTMIKGLRVGRGNSHINTRALTIITWILTGIKIEDINGQPKVFHRTLLAKMKGEINNFGMDPYILYCAKKEGMNIRSIDVGFESRTHGESKSAGSFLKKVVTVFGFIKSIIIFRFI